MPAGFAQEESLWDGAGFTPVHRFPMFDENRARVIPTRPDAMPMSTQWTCGTCHTYSTVAQGFHFNASNPNARAGRPGEPWVWVDRATGSAIPVSERKRAGAFTIEDLGITPWRFTQVFGRSMPGGDFGEPADVLKDPKARWDSSGKLQIDCMTCHNQSPAQDFSERAKQIERGNFRWSATTAAGLGTSGGTALDQPAGWVPADGIPPDQVQFHAPPGIQYVKDSYDANGFFRFDVNRPLDRNCLQCHSSAPAKAERWTHPRDVHSAAGISCVECHRNGLDHDIVRGYEGEAAERKNPAVASFTCAGCHLGKAPDAKLAERGGLFAAPRPLHRGIPPIHFDKLTCTACHSGAALDTEPVAMRTSRANRLGIHGRAQWFTDAPEIVETVFVKGESGKIEPSRLMWPSFWTRSEGGKTVPLTPDAVTTFTRGILDPAAPVVDVLTRLATNPNATGRPLFGYNGHYYALDPNDPFTVADVPTTHTFTGMRWAQETAGGIEPYFPAFDPVAEPVAAQSDPGNRIVETAILLNLWKPTGQPAVVYKGKVISADLEWNPATADAPAETPSLDSPQIVWLMPGGKLEPVVSDTAARDLQAVAGTGFSFTEGQVARVLGAMQAHDPAGHYGFVNGGKHFTLAGGGETLNAGDDAIAGPVAWPIAHDVRPAAQALGARGCMDCHGEKSAFYFASMSGRGPLSTQRTAALPMHELQQTDADFHRLFGRNFATRQLFKNVVAGLLVVLAGIVLVYALRGLGAVTRRFGRSA